MADEADRGNDAAELFLDVALRNTGRPLQAVVGIGQCLNCAEPIDGDGRWCDAECRDEHQAVERARFNAAARQTA
jgi:predicted nucleic acid-binding Zn ribbon protein